MTGKDGILRLEQPPALEDGTRLRELIISYRSWGRLDNDGGNAVLVCPALTGDRKVDRWWPGLFGPGRSLDPHTDFILAVDAIGGSGSTTGPHSRRNTTPWDEQFPQISVRDMVMVQRLLVDALGITRLKLVIGASLGGMQALEWTVGLADRVDAAVIIAAPARQTAWASALNHIQRRALSGHQDLELARMVAMLSYRHWENLDSRFGPDVPREQEAGQWLDFHGRSLRERFHPVSYQRLMGAMDGHDIGRERGGWRQALARTEVDTLVIGITTDLLYPPRDQQELADHLPLARLAWLEAPQGHDAFLIEQARVDDLISGFRRRLALAQPLLEARA